jgi:hypothetical protein
MLYKGGDVNLQLAGATVVREAPTAPSVADKNGLFDLNQEDLILQ